MGRAKWDVEIGKRSSGVYVCDIRRKILWNRGKSMSAFCFCMYNSQLCVKVRGQMDTSVRRPLLALSQQETPEEVTPRSQPRSVIKTPYYPSFSAPSGWTEQERDDEWSKRRCEHLSGSHCAILTPDSWLYCVEPVDGSVKPGQSFLAEMECDIDDYVFISEWLLERGSFLIQGVFSWSQSATSPTNTTKSYTLDLSTVLGREMIQKIKCLLVVVLNRLLKCFRLVCNLEFGHKSRWQNR